LVFLHLGNCHSLHLTSVSFYHTVEEISAVPQSIDSNPPRHHVESHSIASQALHEERTIKVCLPAQYDSRRVYPLLICHDGNEFLSYVRVATIANRLAASEAVLPVIAVFIETVRGRRRDDYHPAGRRSHDYADFVAGECIPAVRDLYGQPAQPHQIALFGASLGACANLRILADHPGVARFTLLFSGFYDPETQAMIAQTDGLQDISAYMVVGQSERQAKTPSGVFDVLTYNEQAHALLSERGVKVDFHIAPGQHTWGFWQQELPAALHWLSDKLHAAAETDLQAGGSGPIDAAETLQQPNHVLDAAGKVRESN